MACRPVNASPTPTPAFVGGDWFTWRVEDGSKQGDYASAFIDVQPEKAAVKRTVGDDAQSKRMAA
jgi:hypothetical protein